MTFWRRPGFARRRRLVRGAGLTDPPPAPTAFTPPPVDVDAYRARIEHHADSLVDALDEATGHALDTLVNLWADQWVAALDAEHEVYLPKVGEAAGEAEARVALTRGLWMHDVSRLGEIGVAVEKAGHGVSSAVRCRVRLGPEGGGGADPAHPRARGRAQAGGGGGGGEARDR